MTDDPSSKAGQASGGQVVERRPPPPPEAPDQPGPPGAAGLEAEVEVSLERPGRTTVAAAKT